MASYLRNNFSIDYRNIYETSKKLRTLGDPIRRLASQILDENNGEVSDKDDSDEGDG